MNTKEPIITIEELYRDHLGEPVRRTERNLVFRCPFDCPEGSSPRFEVHRELGLWCCWKCRYAVPGKTYRKSSTCIGGGTLREFLHLMGDTRRLPKELQTSVKVEAKEHPGIRNIWELYYDACGLSVDDIRAMRDRGVQAERFSCRSCTWESWRDFLSNVTPEDAVVSGLANTSEDGKLYPALSISPGRILIPCFDARGRLQYFFGYLPVDRRQNTDLPKVAGIKGSTPCNFGYPDPQHPLCVVTEGQIKAMSLQQLGVPCIGLAGISNGHIAAKSLLRGYPGKVIICFDEQLLNQQIVDHYAMLLAQRLLEDSLDVYWARLPRQELQEKQDIDGLLLESNGRESLLACLGAAQKVLRAS